MPFDKINFKIYLITMLPLKYNIKNFKKFLLKISQLPMEKQKQILSDEFENWKADFEQIDDVCIILVLKLPK